MTKLEKIIHGDSLDVLKEMADNSVDSVVTDPPYGLSKEPNITEVLTKWLAGEPYDHGHGGFMGKSWDSFVPHPDIWKEVHRVLKPGGHALVFAGTRTQDLMTISLRLAGFEVRDVIEWLYFSGFPKSLDVSKAFEKRVHSREEILKVTAWIKETRDQSGITNRQIDEAFGTNGMAGHWTSQGSQPAVPTLDRIPELLRVLNVKAEDIPQDIRKLLIDSNVTSGEQTSVGHYDITTPIDNLAKEWVGWGTELKPAHEPIIVVRKPFEGGYSVADNIEKYSTGAINIDATRIEDGDPNYVEKALRKYVGTRKQDGSTVANGFGGAEIKTDRPEALGKGRFPANCITLDSDQFYSKYFNISPQEVLNVTPSDLSKKASKKDRNSDWRGEEIALEKRKKFDLENGEGYGIDRFNTLPAQNNHPTVKPTDLMAWLVRLVTPKGGTVLDPFAGSGSTLVAAKREGFGFIGVELTDEYIPIIEARTGIKAEGRSNA